MRPKREPEQPQREWFQVELEQLALAENESKGDITAVTEELAET